MEQKAKQQLSAISIQEIKTILKEKASSAYDKMIISDNQEVLRADYFYTFVRCQKVDRKLVSLRFPLYGSIENDFSPYLQGQGTCVPFENDYIIKEALLLKGCVDGNVQKTAIPHCFDYRLDTQNGDIDTSQKLYYIPSKTIVEKCDGCHGDQYITCAETPCKGKHEWDCATCTGDGEVPCKNCEGSGNIKCKKCSGRGHNKCKTCGGNGSVDHNSGQETCSNCSGNGETRCENCSRKGEIPCSKCSSQGQISCSVCVGAKKIRCSKCYGDAKRYGTVDCVACYAKGKIAQFVYVQTNVSEETGYKVTCKGDDLGISEELIKKQIDLSPNYKQVYSNTNGQITESYDAFSKELIEPILADLGLTKGEFPKVVKESLYYQVIPCVRISYKHVLTNKEHAISIINFWNSPEIFLDTTAEELKQSIGNVAKITKGFFAKLFQSQSHLDKEDRVKEIHLLIRVAKADGKIEAEEKKFLSDELSNLKEFTNGELKEFIDLMDAPSLDELTEDEVTFSTKEKGKEVLEKLKELAQSDGDFDENEKVLIGEIASLIRFHS